MSTIKTEYGLINYKVQPDTLAGWSDLSVPSKKYVDDAVGIVAAGSVWELLTSGDLQAIPSVIGAILPSADDISDLGSPSYRFKDLYLGSKIDASSYLDIWTNGSSRIYINSSGDIGIGTSTPSSKLHLLSTHNNGIRIESIQSAHYLLLSPGNNSIGPRISSTYVLELLTPSAEIRLGRTSGTGTALLYVDSSITSGLVLSGNSTGSPAITILSSGNVGIGTTAPTDTLEIIGTFKLVNSTQGFGKVLTSDADGVGTWETLVEVVPDNVTIGTNTAGELYVINGTGKYSETLTTPGSNVTNTITHNLGTTDISVALWLVTTDEMVTAKVSNRTSNSVDVKFSVAPGEDVRVVVIG